MIHFYFFVSTWNNEGKCANEDQSTKMCQWRPIHFWMFCFRIIIVKFFNFWINNIYTLSLGDICSPLCLQKCSMLQNVYEYNAVLLCHKLLKVQEIHWNICIIRTCGRIPQVSHYFRHEWFYEHMFCTTIYVILCCFYHSEGDIII
jgi:hypothetical protein